MPATLQERIRKGVSTVATRRLYYDDSFQKEFTARVVHCEVLPPDVNSGITGTVWGLILDRTAFYPTSQDSRTTRGRSAMRMFWMSAKKGMKSFTWSTA